MEKEEESETKPTRGNRKQKEGKIKHLGLTNFDTDHLRVVVSSGIKIVSNQVSCSILDRRFCNRMSKFCLAHGIKLLAFGTLLGGLLSDRWLGKEMPNVEDWSKSKYMRYIRETCGTGEAGWQKFQVFW